MISSRMTEWVQEILLPYVKKGTVLVDGTCGNGHDTFFLAPNAPLNAKIFSFDIQAQAIEQTAQILNENQLQNSIDFILGCHSQLDEWISESIDVGMFNLGYLPGSDKSIKTCLEKSLVGIQKICEKLSLHGALSIICYPGHTEGQSEYEGISQFLQKLSSKEYQVMRLQGWNRNAAAPVAFLIERIKEDAK